MSIDELKRVASFPDGFEIGGSFKQRWGQIGNSVPPLMMRAVGRCVRRLIETSAPCVSSMGVTLSR